MNFTSESQSVVGRVKEYINSHLSEEITRNSMAKIVYLNSDYLACLLYTSQAGTLFHPIGHIPHGDAELSHLSGVVGSFISKRRNGPPDIIGSVSYTHLDVYKRQILSYSGWP